MRTLSRVLLTITLAGLSAIAASGNQVAPSPNGIELPADYKDWKVIGVSHRVDNNTMRAVVGNDAAVAAARAGNINPWPNGAVLGKIVWKAVADKNWDKAMVPGDFVHVEFMLKDAQKYTATGGWGYARWKGKELAPYGKDPGFAQECVACHTPVKGQDYVFTRPASMP